MGFIPEFGKPKDMSDRLFDPKASPEVIYDTLCALRTKYERDLSPPKEEEDIAELVDFEIERFLVDLKNGSFALAKKMIARDGSELVMEHIRQFDGDAHMNIACEMIIAEEEDAEYVAENLAEFDNIQYSDLALLMIDSGQVEAVVDYWENFPYLDQRVALKLSELGYSDLVAANLDKFYI